MHDADRMALVSTVRRLADPRSGEGHRHGTDPVHGRAQIQAFEQLHANEEDARMNAALRRSDRDAPESAPAAATAETTEVPAQAPEATAAAQNEQA